MSFNKKEYFKQYYKDNQEKLNAYILQWYHKNKENLSAKRRKSSKKYYKENKEAIREYEKLYRNKNPWVKTYRSIISRCSANKFYINKDIKNYLTVTDLKQLWFRDKAYLMKKPTIHRKNNEKNYTFKNCKYIEFKENLKLRKWKNKKKTKACFL